jgi:HlyD family secretion protein
MRLRAATSIACLGVLALSQSACRTHESPPRLVGTLERDRIEVIAEESEPILTLEVHEGQHVTEGQVLMRQDTELAAARAAQADAQTEQAQHRLTELKKGARSEEIDEAQAQVAAARAAVERDEREFTRVAKLVEQKVLSQAQLDAAQAARNSSRAMLREANARLTALLRGTRIEEIDQARSAVTATEAARQQLAVGENRLVVRATRAGVVDALPYKAGERPPKGATVAVLLADTAPFARIYVPEPQRIRVRPGIAATIYVDGLDHPLHGKVRYIASDAAFTPYFALTQRDRSRLYFLSEVTITDPSARDLPAGVPVEVEILENDRG